MSQLKSYLDSENHPVVSIVKGVDRDVERGEDILMLGYLLILMAPMFAPFAPPNILLPLMALTFAVSVCVARHNFHAIKQKLSAAMALLGEHDLSPLKPISDIFAEHPKHTLADGFNPLKNLMRTAKSTLGAMMINPFWMPIFYTLGLQFAEEKHLQLLNKAVISAERRTEHMR